MSLISSNPTQKSVNLSRYIDPKIFNRIDKLELAAKMVVEGFMAGWHRSPYHGFSVEFAQHREYTMGDDPRHLDWKIYAKANRYYIKQYEVETNFIAHILHDASESMLYGSPKAPFKKLEYANFISAALSYLVVSQTDSVSMGIFNEGLQTFIEPKQSRAHIHRICHELEAIKPAKKTDTGDIMHNFADRIKRRGIVVLVSDLLDKPENIMDGLNHLRFARHEVLVFTSWIPTSSIFHSTATSNLKDSKATTRSCVSRECCARATSSRSINTFSQSKPPASATKWITR
jgi:uncharacterized protein (DUF58 family)